MTIEGATILDFLSDYFTVAADPEQEANITLKTGTPVAIGIANSEGDGDALARANHVHNHGDLSATLPEAHHPVTAIVPTLVVAASDSSAAMQAVADYVCDGTADEVQIQAALAALPATAGRVILSEGNFAIAATVTMTVDNHTLQGAGTATILKAAAGLEAADLIQIGDGLTRQNWVTVRDFCIDSAVTKTAGAAVHFQFTLSCSARNVVVKHHFCAFDWSGGCYGTRMSNIEARDMEVLGLVFNISDEDGSHLPGSGYFIDHLIIDNEDDAQPAYGIRIRAGEGFYWSNIEVLHTQQGLTIDPDTGQRVRFGFINNLICDQSNANPIHIIPVNTGWVEDIHFTNLWGTGSNTLDGFVINPQNTSIVRGITVEQGRFFENDHSGVFLGKAAGATVADVRLHNCFSIGNSVEGANSFDGFHIQDAVSGWHITQCTATNGWNFSGTQRYGVYVEAAASNNYTIKDNDLRGNGTGTLSDGGTGTTKDIRGNLGHAGAWKALYAGLGAQTTELALGAAGTFFRSGGEAAAPTFYDHEGAADPHTPYLLAAGTRLATYLGIGAAASPSADNLLYISKTHLSPAGSLTGFGIYLNSDVEHIDAGTISRNHIGAYLLPSLDIDNTVLNGEQMGLVSGWVVNFGDEAVTIAQATAWKGLIATTGSNGVLTTARAIHVADALVTAGSIGTQYGIDIDALAAATLNVGIRNNATSRLVGSTKMGADAAPTEMLDVAGNIAVTGTVDGVDVAAHAANSDAHHTRYTDAEALAAVPFVTDIVFGSGSQVYFP